MNTPTILRQRFVIYALRMQPQRSHLPALWLNGPMCTIETNNEFSFSLHRVTLNMKWEKQSVLRRTHVHMWTRGTTIILQSRTDCEWWTRLPWSVMANLWYMYYRGLSIVTEISKRFTIPDPRIMHLPVPIISFLLATAEVESPMGFAILHFATFQCIQTALWARCEKWDGAYLFISWASAFAHPYGIGACHMRHRFFMAQAILPRFFHYTLGCWHANSYKGGVQEML